MIETYNNEVNMKKIIRRVVFNFITICLTIFSLSALAADKTEPAAVVKMPVKKVASIELNAKNIAKAKKQLYYLLDKSYKKGEEELKKTGKMQPYAAVIKPDGKVQMISLGDAKMPADFAINVLHKALNTLAHKGKIGASAIYYIIEDPKIKNKKIKLLAIEMEHSIGVGFLRVTPFEVNNHKLAYGKGKETRMKELFVMVKPSTKKVEPKKDTVKK
jgi:hypothetical protein